MFIRFLRSVLLCFLLIAFSQPLYAKLFQSKEDKQHKVEDSAYGEVLFSYYQNNDFDALTRLLVAKERGEFTQQEDKGEVLLGGLYLRWGILDEAQAIFDKVLSETKNQDVARRAWFYLARLYYRQARYNEALLVLQNKLDLVPEDLQQNYDLLYAQILMKQGRFDEAVGRLANVQSDDLASAYLKYNLAIVRLNADVETDSDSLLWELRDQKRGNDEKNALIDKSGIALAAYYIRDERSSDAVSALKRVRMDGPFSAEAISLNGLAAWRQGDNKLAAKSWRALAKRDPRDLAVQEASLNLGHAYKRSKSMRKAMLQYQKAIGIYQDTFRYFLDLEKRIQQGDWFNEALWFYQSSSAPVALRQTTTHQYQEFDSVAVFHKIFSGHLFVNAMDEYVEMANMRESVLAWQESLSALELMVANQIDKHEEVVPDKRQLLLDVEKQKLQEQYDRLQQRYSSAVESGDYLTFANEKERELLQKLYEAEALANKWGERVPEKAQQDIAFYRGMLAWNIQQDIVPRQWVHEKQLIEISRTLRAQSAAKDSVEAAEQFSAGFSVGKAQAIREEANKLDNMLQRADRIMAKQKSLIETLAIKEVAAHKSRLQNLTAQAYFSLGELGDLNFNDDALPDAPLSPPLSKANE